MTQSQSGFIMQNKSIYNPSWIFLRLYDNSNVIRNYKKLEIKKYIYIYKLYI